MIASGLFFMCLFGVRLLQMLHGSGVETHLVVSKWAARTLAHETPHSLKYVQDLATESYGIGAQGAAISSGSFVTMGMVIAPCSMRTLAAIAHGLGDNLIHRAADVILKERRKLVLVVRESPFSENVSMSGCAFRQSAKARRTPPSPVTSKPAANLLTS